MWENYGKVRNWEENRQEERRRQEGRGDGEDAGGRMREAGGTEAGTRKDFFF